MIELFGLVKDGVFECSKDSSIAETDWLRDNEGAMVRKTYMKKARLRTLKKLRFYKGVFLPRVASEQGYTVDEVEDWFKAQHMTTYNLCPFTDKLIPHVESWADTTDERATELIDWCMKDAWSIGIPLEAEYNEFMGRIA